MDGDEQAFCYNAGKWAVRGGCTGAGQPSPARSLEAGAVAGNPLPWRGCEEPCARTREGQASRPGLVPCSRSWPRVFLWLSVGRGVCGRVGGEVGRPQAELAVSWDPLSLLERDPSAGWGAVRGRSGLHAWAPCSEEHSWQKAGAAAERPGEGGGRHGGVCSGPPAGSRSEAARPAPEDVAAETGRRTAAEGLARDAGQEGGLTGCAQPRTQWGQGRRWSQAARVTLLLLSPERVSATRSPAPLSAAWRQRCQAAGLLGTSLRRSSDIYWGLIVPCILTTACLTDKGPAGVRAQVSMLGFEPRLSVRSGLG